VRVLHSKVKANSKDYKHLLNYSHYSNNLYNYCLYITNEYFRETGKYIGRFNLDKAVSDNENYKLLPAQTSQQIVKLIDQNFRSFMALLKKKNRGQYSADVSTPRYKKKGGLYDIYFTNQQFKLSNGKIQLAVGRKYKADNKISKILIKFNKEIDGTLQQLVLKPINKGQYFKLILIYKENNSNQKLQSVETNKISIDLGINNFATVYSTVTRPFILNGKPLKSYNSYYNKQKAKITSQLKINNNKHWSKKLQKLEENRNNYISNYFHQYSSYLKKYCIENQISEVILGYNKEWKQNINLGKVNNQKFNSIPYYKFKEMLRYKLEEIGVKYTIHEESYTSKCSSLDLERVGKHEKYLGKRVKRGLFKSSEGKYINADLNGAINIMRKVTDDVLTNQSVLGLVFNPVKINLLKDKFMLTKHFY
jgi:putative transposase